MITIQISVIILLMGLAFAVGIAIGMTIYAIMEDSDI